MTTPLDGSAVLPKPSVENGGMLGAALWYAQMGFRVHPLRVNGKTPNGSLLGTGWAMNEIGSRDPDVIRRWWGPNGQPLANIGIAHGVQSGTLVIDMDTKRGVHPDRSIHKWATETGITLTYGPTCTTPSGGWHHWMLLPSGVKVAPRCHGWLPGVDVQGDGSYVVVPPSFVKVHVSSGQGDPKGGGEMFAPYQWVDRSGREYWPSHSEFLASLGRSTVPLPFMIDVGTATIRKRLEHDDVALADIKDGKAPVPIEHWRLNGIPVGEQQEGLWMMACSLSGSGVPIADAFEILWETVGNCAVGKAEWPWDTGTVGGLLQRAYDGLPQLRSNELAGYHSAFGGFLDQKAPGG